MAVAVCLGMRCTMKYGIPLELQLSLALVRAFAYFCLLLLALAALAALAACACMLHFGFHLFAIARYCLPFLAIWLLVLAFPGF